MVTKVKESCGGAGGIYDAPDCNIAETKFRNWHDI